MNWKRALLVALLAAFSAMTARVLWEHGYFGFYDLMLANSATQLGMFDLVIALALICTWMIEDARSRGEWPVLYVLLTLAFGSAGPLLYLIRRGTRPIRQEKRPSASVVSTRESGR